MSETATQREKLTLTKEQARQLTWGGNKEFKTISEEITGTSRWSIHKRIVVQRLPDGKFFADEYSEGATEIQDESAFEYSDPDFTEVFPKEKTITVYV